MFVSSANTNKLERERMIAIVCVCVEENASKREKEKGNARIVLIPPTRRSLVIVFISFSLKVRCKKK